MIDFGFLLLVIGLSVIFAIPLLGDRPDGTPPF